MMTEGKNQLRRNRIVAVGLTLAVIFCLFFLLYAFYQKAQAETLVKRLLYQEREMLRQRDSLRWLQHKLSECEKN